MKQIAAESEKFAGSSGIHSAVVYGGVPKGTQIRPCMMVPLNSTGWVVCLGMSIVCT